MIFLASSETNFEDRLRLYWPELKHWRCAIRCFRDGALIGCMAAASPERFRHVCR